MGHGNADLDVVRLRLWEVLLVRIEELWQEDLESFKNHTNADRRDFVVTNCPYLKTAVDRIPSDNETVERAELDLLSKYVPVSADAIPLKLPSGALACRAALPFRMKLTKRRDLSLLPLRAHLLRTLSPFGDSSLPDGELTVWQMPEKATIFDMVLPRVVCQKFRANEPVTITMLEACYDPYQNMKFYADHLRLHQMLSFVFLEFTYIAMGLLVYTGGEVYVWF